MNFRKADKIKNTNGYVWVYIGEDNPHAMSNGYIYEHRFVMWQALGRPLKENEQVQHKDGNQRNNIISNLELWIDDPKLGLVKENTERLQAKFRDITPKDMLKSFKNKEKAKKESSMSSRVVNSYILRCKSFE